MSAESEGISERRPAAGRIVSVLVAGLAATCLSARAGVDDGGGDTTRASRSGQIQESDRDAVSSPSTRARPESLDAYRERAPRGGSSADAQVRLALWCESHGLGAERLKHLALAVLTDPAHSVARGLLGQVGGGGRWLPAENASHQGLEGRGIAAASAEYAARRARMANSAEAHWDLALWCERRGLSEESTAHLIAVTRLAPGHEGAWKRLGYRRFHGRWRTESQIAREREEREAQEKADRSWRLELSKWRGQLANPRTRAEAESALADVTDPRAFNSVLAVFGNGGAPDQARAVRLLGQLDSSPSTRTLALFALAGSTPEVRREASEILARRDHHEALGLLIAMLRDPEPNPNSIIYRFQMIPLGALGVGSPGVTFIEGRHGNILRFYMTAASNAYLRAMREEALLPSVSDGVRVGAESYQDRILRETGRQLTELEEALRGLVVEANLEAAMVRESTKHRNAQVIQVLKRISGVDRDGDWESWKRWWVEERGYSYRADLFRTPPDLSIDGPKATFVSTLDMSHSCFAAGTAVRTSNGLRPIESIRVGDRVLTQDTQTGSLSFEPVVAALRNPPDATYRVEIGGESLVATGIHRFWKVGRGWAMARDLKPGDAIRLLGDVGHVRRVAPERTQPVYNLEVANHQSYFVGRQSALVHDNSPVEPVVRPFDAVLDFEEARGTKPGR